MTKLPRVDQMEELLKKEWEQGLLTTNLNKDLAEELREMKLLDKLISKRIDNFVRNILVSENYSGQTDEKLDKEDNISEKLLARISHEWFESQVNRYYLEKKDSFERISFQIFRTTIKGIAIEAHQRLTEGEEGWQTIIKRWGLEEEKQNEGKYLQVAPSNINKEIYTTLSRLKKREISEPFRTKGRFFAIVQLLHWKEVKLDNELKVKLERDMYREWVLQRTSELITYI